MSSDGDDQMSIEIKTQNPLGLPTQSLNQNLTLKKSHAEFPSLKNFQKGLNDISTTKGNFSDDKASQ